MLNEVTPSSQVTARRNSQTSVYCVLCLPHSGEGVFIEWTTLTYVLGWTLFTHLDDFFMHFHFGSYYTLLHVLHTMDPPKQEYTQCHSIPDPYVYSTWWYSHLLPKVLRPTPEDPIWSPVVLLVLWYCIFVLISI